MPAPLIFQPFVLFVLVASWAPVSGQTVIPLDDLPPPPAELKRLLDAGRVRFEFGGAYRESPASESDPDARETASGLDTDSDGTFKKRFAAETRFRIEFDYETRTTWRFFPAGRELRISAKLRRFGWQPSHTVWFRESPDPENFWSNPLVLHEFDHVRLSTDSRLRARFDELTRQPFTIRHPLPAGQSVSRQLVDGVVDDHLQNMHREVVDLIRIRYQELDLETTHGRESLRSDSPLYELLRTGAPTTLEP